MPSRKRFAGNGASKGVPVSLRPAPSGALTPREEEVAEWIGQGKGNSEIGEILGCRLRTVETHVSNILKKLHMETRNHICAWWHERRQSLAGAQPKPGR
jgi:DNA-binding CsgD family transcriptional regulator